MIVRIGIGKYNKILIPIVSIIYTIFVMIKFIGLGKYDPVFIDTVRGKL